MKSLRERAAEGLQVGDTFRTSRIFTHNDVIHFAQISRDYNPIHFDVRFAKARNFYLRFAMVCWLQAWLPK
jgi:3-hydroxybutyryl-CoA dehydratase